MLAGLLVKESLKITNDVMRIYLMIDTDKIKYTGLLLKDDTKA